MNLSRKLNFSISQSPPHSPSFLVSVFFSISFCIYTDLSCFSASSLTWSTFTWFLRSAETNLPSSSRLTSPDSFSESILKIWSWSSSKAVLIWPSIWFPFKNFLTKSSTWVPPGALLRNYRLRNCEVIDRELPRKLPKLRVLDWTTFCLFEVISKPTFIA